MNVDRIKLEKAIKSITGFEEPLQRKDQNA
jgi:hypothetical protein